MRDREAIEKDVPTNLPAYDENYDIIGHRNNQRILTVILEVLLDIREMIQRYKGVSWQK